MRWLLIQPSDPRIDLIEAIDLILDFNENVNENENERVNENENERVNENENEKVNDETLMSSWWWWNDEAKRNKKIKWLFR